MDEPVAVVIEEVVITPMPEETPQDNDDDNNITDWAHLYETGVFEDELMHEAEKMQQENNNLTN